MADEIITALKNSDFFNGLPDEVITQLAGQFDPVLLEKDETLFQKGDQGDALFLVESGHVKMVIEDKDGSEMVLNEVGSGAVIGEMALIDDQPRSAGVVATVPTKMLRLSEDTFLKVLMEQPQLGIQISRNAIRRLRFATTYIENAIDWSKRIAAGDYGFLAEEKEKADNVTDGAAKSDKERAERFLGTFFKMVEDIKAREDDLKQQLTMLKVEIDHSRRRTEVQELASSEFFQKLREQKEQDKKTKGE